MKIPVNAAHKFAPEAVVGIAQTESATGGQYVPLTTLLRPILLIVNVAQATA